MPAPASPGPFWDLEAPGRAFLFRYLENYSPASTSSTRRQRRGKRAHSSSAALSIR